MVSFDIDVVSLDNAVVSFDIDVVSLDRGDVSVDTGDVSRVPDEVPGVLVCVRMPRKSCRLLTEAWACSWASLTASS